MDRLFEVSHATRQDRENPPGEVRSLVQQPAEVGAIDDEQPEIGRRHHCRGSGFPIDQAHLAKEVTRSELATSSDRSSHHHRAVDDDEERIAGLSNLRDDLPGRRLDDPRELGDSTKLVFVEPAEERNSLQVSYPRIAGGPGRASVCRLCFVRIMEGQAVGDSRLLRHAGPSIRFSSSVKIMTVRRE